MSEASHMARPRPSKLPPARKKRLSREERAESAKQELFRAAASVIAEHGYSKASISKITAAAGVAQGTFYLYFGSRQDILDELLPHVGAEILEFIRERVRGAKNFYDMEERGLRAYFEYLDSNPGFSRILNEAEAVAPIAHRSHFKMLTDRYLGALSHWIKKGDIRHFEPGELETLAYMMMSARSYLYMLYNKDRSNGIDSYEKIVGTYMKTIRNGVN